MISFLFISFAFAFTYNGEEMHYAVLTSGSNGYMNYRHQADVCHAYHVLRAGGMPEENIIVLSVDDAATSPENPFPGKLYNKPTHAADENAKPVDVREGCNIDYKGRSVTKETFIAVLTGDAEYAATLNGTGRVLQSTSSDNVFINFVDHGGVKLIAFPQGTMKANELYETLKTMHSNEMYKNLVFYMEACESGSMFEDILPTDWNIYALTAANGKESSWGTYCPPQDIVQGKHLKTCLGDLFSVNWMEQTDKERSRTMFPFNITLERQYHVVKKETNKSHVMQFGDLTIVSEKIDVFEGDVADDMKFGEGSDEFSLREHHHNHMKLRSAVDSRDIRLHVFYQNYVHADNREERENAFEKLNEELALRHKYDFVFSSFKQNFGLTSPVSGETNWECYSDTIDFFEETCKKPVEHDYVMKYYGLLHDACMQQSEKDIQKALSSLC